LEHHDAILSARSLADAVSTIQPASSKPKNVNADIDLLVVVAIYKLDNIRLLCLDVERDSTASVQVGTWWEERSTMFVRV